MTGSSQQTFKIQLRLRPTGNHRRVLWYRFVFIYTNVVTYAGAKGYDALIHIGSLYSLLDLSSCLLLSQADFLGPGSHRGRLMGLYVDMACLPHCAFFVLTCLLPKPMPYL